MKGRKKGTAKEVKVVTEREVDAAQSLGHGVDDLLRELQERRPKLGPKSTRW